MLPDCARADEELTSDDLFDRVDRAALVRALAEEGIEGARALLQRAAGSDEELARRLAALREELRRQASRRVARRLGVYDRRGEELGAIRIRHDAELRSEMEALAARLKAAREVDLSRIADPGLFAEVREALLLPEATWNRPPRRGLLERLRRLLVRIRAFFRRLFGRSTAPPRASRDRTVTFATLAAEGRSIDGSLIGRAVDALSPPEQGELRERIGENLHRREDALRREAEAKRRAVESQQRELEAERAEAEARAAPEIARSVKEAEARRTVDELSERGLVAERNGELAVTYALVERFARLVLEDEARTLPGDVRRSLKGAGSTGIYEKARLQQSEEIAHLDIPSSVLAARLEGSRHLDEGTSFVYREILSERVHVVLAVDRSGSMAEAGKLPAAKKALLALYTAVRRRYPDATVDVFAFDNEVQVLDLVELWECEPGSFTNTGAALHLAQMLLRASRANRKELFLITDGLPEAYTDPTGAVRSGNPDAALENALRRARELSTVGPLRFTMILLRSAHPEFERAARLITRTLGGELVVTDPGRLGFELLVRWAGGTETARAPRAVSIAAGSPSEAAAASPGTPAVPGARRRRADRRMGG
ncbi:MAG: hypothetical protein ACREC5_00275 [Thermoplasmata archaeon]